MIIVFWILVVIAVALVLIGGIIILSLGSEPTAHGQIVLTQMAMALFLFACLPGAGAWAIWNFLL